MVALTPSEVVYALDTDEYDHFTREWRFEAPNDRVAAALVRLLAGVDELSCEMDNCQADTTTVGWSIYGDRDESMRWQHTAIVDDGTTAYLACGDCHAALLPRRQG